MGRLRHIAISAPDPCKAAEFSPPAAVEMAARLRASRVGRAPHPTPLPASGEREGPAGREGEGQSVPPS